ncbi:MAG: S4 domain-containing protein [Proteobacteria bacterium]|nr:S4 domain-containing protein [Pseudomonadota bacterium]
MAEALRADRWLWFARLFKSRTMAAEACAARRIRRNGQVMAKSNQLLRPGDVLTWADDARVRVIRVVAIATRRGPAAEARTMYEDMSAAVTRPPVEGIRRTPGSGRPTKADRRATERLRGRN